MKTWYNIKVDVKNNATSEAEISIYDDIGAWGIDASNFKEDLDKVKNLKSIKLLINSPGGSVFDGIGIYNMLKEYRDKLTVEINGIAASIASIIAMSGGNVIMREGTFLMIHNPFTVSIGDSDEMRKTADTLDQIKNQLVSIYVNNSNLDSATIESLMDEETWMDGEKAIEYGFVDEVVDAPRIAASFNKDIENYGFKHLPEDEHKPKETVVATNSTDVPEFSESTTTETTTVIEADVSASDVDAREALLKQILVFKINNFLKK